MRLRTNPIVLVVEDNPDDEELTVRALKRTIAGCNVIVKRDGEEAAEYLRELETGGDDGNACPDLFLLDLKLPKINGLELLHMIRCGAVTSRVPAIMLTSSDEPADLERSYAIGAAGFVRKPVDYEAYVDTVKLIAKFWLEININPPCEGSKAKVSAK